MTLFYQQYSPEQGVNGEQQCPVVIVPGLFGSTINWRGFARKLSVEYEVIVVDQRNHGQSPHADTHTYADMVGDLLSLIDDLGFDKITLCGHSMGGKVAMMFALLHPERVEKLAVLDIAPVTYTHSHAPYLKALMAIDLTAIGSRSEAEAILKTTIPDTGTRLFLMQSLVGSPGEYRWRLNLPVLYQYMPDVVGFPDQSLLGLMSDLEAMFLVGGDSDYVKPEHDDLIKQYFPQAYLTKIDGAGHWLHAEQPVKTLDAMMGFLKK